MPKITGRLPEFCKRPPFVGAAFVALAVLISVASSTHSLLALFNLEGLLIVVGGVIAVAFMSFQIDDVKKALDAIADMFKAPSTAHENIRQDMMEIVAWASVIREKGMRDFETTIGKSGIRDPFVRYAIDMAVSGYTAEEVRIMLETAAESCYERDSAPAGILHAMASHAPAFGMIGTLVGMVAMLCNLNDNVANIGSSLAISFLSTLYGVISARLVYLPAAARLQRQIDSRHFRYHLITEGIIMLVGNKTPTFIQDHLNSFLRPENRNYQDYYKANLKHTDKAVRPVSLKIVRA